MSSKLLKITVLLAATSLALGGAELVARWLPKGHFEHHQEDADHGPLDFGKALELGNIEQGTLPRGRARWAKEHTFYLCYPARQRSYMDERGCVRIDINRFGLRDRLDLEQAKPAGVRRVLCLGDSFTFGWGVAGDLVWPRLVETALRQDDADVQVVNCGASGTLLLDECWWGLRDRFGAFEPDVVLQSICLNDLVPMPDVIALHRSRTVKGCDLHDHRVRFACADCRTEVEKQIPGWLSQNSALWRLLTQQDSLDSILGLDPEVDWGQWLLDIPEDWPVLEDPEQRNFYEYRHTPVESTWRGGGPQAALRASAAWCRERGLKYGVVIWPLFQGLEDHYPFETLHRVVREECADAGIPVLDLLPVFRGRESSTLWVDPSDMHGNEVAHELAVQPIAEFTESLLRD